MRSNIRYVSAFIVTDYKRIQGLPAYTASIFVPIQRDHGQQDFRIKPPGIYRPLWASNQIINEK